ncbi:ATP-binding cassette domain-containing protein, partial [Streptomyces sp. NRRL B-24085]|uniref:ATP-binding cassette domain-containing protein n=1 Tax=Streptomyces sp. NRRL B-24085 TaxID=1709476 RepID=UPI00131CE058
SLTGVSFAYGPAATPVVDRLDLALPRGAHLAVVGPSGIGKSTLTALVAGLLEPTGGRIRLCGHPVPSPDAAALRVLIPQEAYVHTGTLAENLGHRARRTARTRSWCGTRPRTARSWAAGRPWPPAGQSQPWPCEIRIASMRLRAPVLRVIAAM